MSWVILRPKSPPFVEMGRVKIVSWGDHARTGVFRIKEVCGQQAGAGGRTELLASAGLGNKFYMATQEYPDAEVVALVTAASHKTKIPANDLLEAFGEFITPSLLRMFGHLAKPSWRTLELIENAEEAIHSVVRISNPGAKPPQSACRR